MDEPRGFLKAVVDADTGLILGAAVLGIEGGEVMAALQLAMMGRLPYTVLWDAVFAHPTLAEAFNNLFTTSEGWERGNPRTLSRIIAGPRPRCPGVYPTFRERPNLLSGGTMQIIETQELVPSCHRPELVETSELQPTCHS